MVKDWTTNETANVNEICLSMKEQIIRMVEWAKNIPVFSEFSMNDQITLLKAHVGEHLLLGVAKRSLTTKDFLHLGNNHITTKLTAGERSDTRYKNYQKLIFHLGLCL